ncbi:hypothetical protein OAL56_00530 [Candidatus Pelagibacter sp.]|nr:hypothetical protein [Candidatus Pelagibacter sp.]|tara:strand:- start:118 stop:384 length:267 start_codon:yes stop_codon:yes gene_type:complete
MIQSIILPHEKENIVINKIKEIENDRSDLVNNKKICRYNIFSTYFGKDSFYPIHSDSSNNYEFQAQCLLSEPNKDFRGGNLILYGKKK